MINRHIESVMISTFTRVTVANIVLSTFDTTSIQSLLSLDQLISISSPPTLRVTAPFSSLLSGESSSAAISLSSIFSSLSYSSNESTIDFPSLLKSAMSPLLSRSVLITMSIVFSVLISIPITPISVSPSNTALEYVRICSSISGSYIGPTHTPFPGLFTASK